MTEYLIGTGGWAYFQIPGVHPLLAYSKAFNFVEVNSTFYELPSLKEVETWRKLVPKNFQFTVRANKALTHKHKLQPTQKAIKTFEKMKQICTILNAPVLHLQASPNLVFNENNTKNLRELLSSINLAKLRLALEIRGTQPFKLPLELVKAMQDYNMIHCVDLSKGETPAYESDILYSRLFGKGQHNIYQPSDEELTQIDKKAVSGAFQKIILSFHFVRMYKDAVRLKIYKETGKFPKITKYTGIASLEEVLREDAQFPTTKEALIKHQGWKLFDITEDKRIRVAEFLQNLPEKTYKNVGEVIEILHSAIR
ncbi:DUF72 domain-containing protein [Candidatus Bathyarchaeota archaeon]|nr:DUF72 domain-containing protein [Candidatus Bathyarchaeota archaeon]